MIPVIHADGTAEQVQIDAMRARAAEKNADIERAVRAIMQSVKEEGFPAVERYTQLPMKSPPNAWRRPTRPARRS